MIFIRLGMYAIVKPIPAQSKNGTNEPAAAALMTPIMPEKANKGYFTQGLKRIFPSSPLIESSAEMAFASVAQNPWLCNKRDKAKKPRVSLFVFHSLFLFSSFTHSICTSYVLLLALLCNLNPLSACRNIFVPILLYAFMYTHNPATEIFATRIFSTEQSG